MYKEISLTTKKRTEFIKITRQISDFVRAQKIESGTVIVFVPHTTAAVTINENADPDVVCDIDAHLKKIIPNSSDFKHSEGNSDAHIKASLTGSSVTVIIDNGELVLGTWQGVFFAEYDGPRTRKVIFKIIRD